MMRDRESQTGLSAIELLVVLVIISISVVVSIPHLAASYRRFQLESASTAVRSLVEEARGRALKEKASYRIVLNTLAGDDTIEFQREQGGAFVTLANRTYTLPSTVRIMNQSPMDSMDRIDVDSQGRCVSGRVYFGSHQGDVTVVAVAPTCISVVS